jgi:hypothetical protein
MLRKYSIGGGLNGIVDPSSKRVGEKRARALDHKFGVNPIEVQRVRDRFGTLYN